MTSTQPAFITADTRSVLASCWSRESLLLVLRAQRERTATLSAVTGELNQELAETVEERTALELQLDHMRPDND